MTSVTSFWLWPGKPQTFKVQDWICGPEVLIVFPLARLESVEKEIEQNIFMTMAYQSGLVHTVGGEWVSVGGFYDQLVMNEKLNAGKVVLIFWCLRSFERQQKLLHFSSWWRKSKNRLSNPYSKIHNITKTTDLFLTNLSLKIKGVFH